MKLDNRVALITGGGSGIGRAIAQRFAAEGARVVVCGRTAGPLEASVAGLPAGAPKSAAIIADVADSAAVRSMFAEIDRDFGRVDVLVNNAGIGVDDVERYNQTIAARGKELSTEGRITTPWQMTASMPDEIWHRMIGVHLDGMFFCTREALKRMGPGGAIINVSSTAALAGQEGAPHYSAAKAGMLGFTKSLAREVGSQNIRVNALCPGFVETAMSAGYSEGMRRGSLGRIPLGRWGTPDEVATAALFLASDDGAYLTGQCLSPNGGIYMA